MKKSFLRASALLLALVLLASALVSCDLVTWGGDTEYTVTFVGHDGTVLKTETVAKGGTATAPVAPVREGYVFEGWDKAFDNVSASITVTALYREGDCTAHTDQNSDDACDGCGVSVAIVLDLLALNDLHGKFDDVSGSVGVDELSTYLSAVAAANPNTILLSSGDMWQGSAESNLTKGSIITDWMNAMGFASMTVGNHEFDWGAEFIEDNAELAEFSFLAINVYDVETGERAEFCEASVIVERGGVKIGIIGAIGDCYSSISASMVEGYEFKVGSDLTALVKAESERLRAEGCELIIYSLHDGYGSSASSVQRPSSTSMRSYYDVALSRGYVDVVFEGHTHQSYVHVDTEGVYHLQNGGYDDGISHVELKLNYVTDTVTVSEAEIVKKNEYLALDDHPVVDSLLDKYEDTIGFAYEVLGYNGQYLSSSAIKELVASLYLSNGLAEWGAQYDIVLGGGYISTRDPGVLRAGAVRYLDLVSVLPFDNAICLCTIKGSKLKSQFINTTNSNYFVAYSAYGQSVKNNINNNATYYVIADRYSVDYAPNGLTCVAELDPNVFARDLVAEYIREGGLGTAPEALSIASAISMANGMTNGTFTEKSYYVEGTITQIVSTQYGNMYIEDESGNRIYLYGLYDQNGNRYDQMENAPVVGDKIGIYATVGKYDGAPELKDGTLVRVW